MQPHGKLDIENRYIDVEQGLSPESQVNNFSELENLEASLPNQSNHPPIPSYLQVSSNTIQPSLPSIKPSPSNQSHTTKDPMI